MERKGRFENREARTQEIIKIKGHFRNKDQNKNNQTNNRTIPLLGLYPKKLKARTEITGLKGEHVTVCQDRGEKADFNV